MINNIAKFLLICGGLIATEAAVACSCAGRPLPEVYADSEDVYVAEVISVRRVTQNPRHNEQATYEIEVRPLMLLKGRAPESMKLNYTTTYHDERLVLAATDDELVEYSVTSCDSAYDVGTTFLFLLKRQEPIASVGMCSQRAHANPQPATIRAIKELLP
jgi:hypothetical protein